MILIVTGTGTDVGKTVVTAALAALGPGSAAVVKPAQTGVRPGEAGDLAEVARLSGVTSLHEFARYPDPLSPEAAARRVGERGPDLDDVASRIRKLDEDLVLVEGAGGLLVRFAADGWTLLDLARELAAPVLVVAAPGLGTLNHTALTLRVLRQEGVDTAGVIIGRWPAHPGLAELSNVDDLAALTDSKRLAGAIPDGMASRADFRTRVRATLAPSLGGTFDWPAFRSASRQE